MNAFSHLFSPFPLGGVIVRNRIVSTGHDTVMAHDGQVTERLIAYHEARAKGGVGLIIAQVAGVHETARYTSHMLMANSDACIPGYRKLAERVHAHGATLLAQLFHPGREIMETDDGTAPVAYAPSAVPNSRFHVMPVQLSETMIGDRGLRFLGATAQRSGARWLRNCSQPRLLTRTIFKPPSQSSGRSLWRKPGKSNAVHLGRGVCHPNGCG